MALPRAWVAAFVLLLFYASASAASLQSSFPMVSNISSADQVSSTTLNISTNIDEEGDCFTQSTQHRTLYPARPQDCLNAARELYDTKPPFRPTAFSRKAGAGFKLPQVVRSGTCIISIDVRNDEDEDIFLPWLVYTTALDLGRKCTRGDFRFGGRTMAGPRKVVDVLVLGRNWSIREVADERTALKSAVVVARERLTGVDSILLNKTSPQLTKSLVANTKNLDKGLNLSAPEVGGILECNDPPLPRERAWPINFKDCDVATKAMFLGREPKERYTFSRNPVATNFYYPLPATFKHKSCVVHLDMSNNLDEDTVRLSIVEATAYVLAHKCSGEEKSVDRYGGRTTVGVGSQNLINVWVYGRRWPAPLGATNVTNLVLIQTAPSISSE